MFRIYLKTARERMGLSQKELSKMLGVSAGSVGNWEAGLREPGLETIAKIASSLNVSVSYLINGTEEQKNNPPPAGASEGLNNIYFSLAKELQTKKIDPEDVRHIIDLLEGKK
ncbi:MAG: helix-turn-helix domain-containing protein [Oscillospiraceae bacterium]